MSLPLLERSHYASAADAKPSRENRSSALDHVTLLSRLDALRRTIVAALASLSAVFVICFAFSGQIVGILLAPVRAALPPGAELVALTVTEPFLLHLRASLLVAIALVLPVWLYQLSRWLEGVVPQRHGLAFAPVALIGTALFGVGAAFGHFVLFPQAVRFLTTFGSDTVHVMLSVGTTFSLYSRFVLGIGAAFQVPTVVYVLSQLGLVTPASLIRMWQGVVLAAFTLAAVVTPTPDMVTQSLLAIPLIVLYFVSIGLCWVVRRRQR